MYCALSTLFVLVIVVLAQSDAKPYVRDRKYSDNPGRGACANDRYRCEGGRKCIPLKWICDGVHDCDDKLDERNCFAANETSSLSYINSQDITEAQSILDARSSLASQEGTMAASQKITESGCPRSTFSCDKGDKCLLLSSLCDGVSECQDGTDEKNCPVNTGCKSNRFSCDEEIKCIPLTWVCDDINDCNDSRDEHNCPEKTGKSLARAAEEAAITAAQEAKRAADAAQELMHRAKEAADKARRAMKIAEASKQNKV